ncbi:MAG: MGMT family protein [Alphaproteobacteria bacterium]|nr:MGMT family protein [Alphaproteobacteria bacterium]
MTYDNKYEIIPDFLSKEEFLRVYPTLHYGVTEEWFVVTTPDSQVCALALNSFPDPSLILRRFRKHKLEKKEIRLDKKLSCILAGTPFQHQVWSALLKIPLGSLVTYQDIAKDVQRPKAVRAVGSAVGANPISPLIPCHRVVGSNGRLGGYYWGLEAKRDLLRAEGAAL